jgi:ferredoxin
MSVVVDRDRCVGAGMCALTAPQVFDQDATPSVGRPAPTRDAVRACPSGAVTT